jgi:hypothetical protein
MTPTHQFRYAGLGPALNADWNRIREAAPPDGWRRTAALDGCHTLDDVLAQVRRCPDGVLGALIGLCGDGDELAGRTVLQAMLGKLIRLARSDPYATLDDYVTAMWLRIRTYPLVERPVRIAANLALDTMKAVQRQSRFPAGIEVTSYPPAALLELLSDWTAPTGGVDLDARALIDAAAECGLIGHETRSVLTSVYVDGLCGTAAAHRHGKSAGAIRFRCHKAVRVMAQHGPMLAAAA